MYAIFIPASIVGIFVVIWRFVLYYFNIALGILASIIIVRREAEVPQVRSPQLLSGITAIFLTGMGQVRCKVKGVFVAKNEVATVPVVLLNDKDDHLLPIFIGLWEAVAINSAINREVLPRPFTHDLFSDLMGKFGITLVALRIDSVENGVYFAEIVCSGNNHEESIDCRPSDGIAIALRGDAPIFVEESVLAAAGQAFADLPDLIELSTFLQK